MGYWSNVVAAVMGRSALPPVPPAALERAYGADYGKRLWPNEQAAGVRTPWVPVSLRWLPEDIESVWAESENGNMYYLASLIRGMKLNGTIDGLMSTRSSIVRLPIVFQGDPFLCAELRGIPATYTDDGVLIDPGVPGAFEQMCPPAALKDLIYTGTMGGVAPFELVDEGGPDPVVTPRDLHFLRFDWGGREWTFQGGQDVYALRPGNGRWGLYSPGGVDRPWQGGAWLPCAFPHVASLAALFDRLRWQALLADPLKWIKAGTGASQAYLKEMQWFIDTQWARAPGIALPPGYEAGLSESDAKGWEVYNDAEARADRMIQIALAGQTQTVDGGPGFSNASIFDCIAETFIQDTASSLARCLTKHVIEPWVERRWKLPRSRAPRLAWDVRSPTRRRQDAEFITAVATSVLAADNMLQKRGQMVDVPAYLASNAINLPVMALPGTTTGIRVLPGGQGQHLLPPATLDDPETIDVDVEEDSGEELEEPASLARLTAAFDESKQKRADDGKFGQGAGKGVPAKPGTTTAHLQTHGVKDSQLSYLRDPGTHREESVAHFAKVYAQGKADGQTPTDIAMAQAPIRLDVYPDGKIALGDGRHRYGAARDNGAKQLRAVVTEYGKLGGVKSEKTITVPLS